MVIQSDVFWKAFVLTLVIFLLGIFMGFWLDNARVEQIRSEYKEMEISSIDARLQTLYYQIFKNSSNFCEPAIEENLRFADKIYAEGLRIEQYEKINKLTPSLISDKRRYMLLKLQFWLNCIELKRNCNASYTNVVYFYSGLNETMEEYVQGIVLMDLKESCGRDMMLIPLAVDLNITTIDIVKHQYNITTTPTILIDEKIKLEGLQKRKDLERYIKCG
ncbi:MAG TPA: hypothetical protein ENG12_04830 [Candidatus Altiarchaeales archaeon]|nr:hypothetical protein [Candidatus Altiarchaeales archaeon]